MSLASNHQTGCLFVVDLLTSAFLRTVQSRLAAIRAFAKSFKKLLVSLERTDDFSEGPRESREVDREMKASLGRPVWTWIMAHTSLGVLARRVFKSPGRRF